MKRIRSARKERCKRKKEVVIGNPDKICREIRKYRQRRRKLSVKDTEVKCKEGKRQMKVK
jgi:hypothetical protein